MAHASFRKILFEIRSFVVDRHLPLEHADIAGEAVERRTIAVGQFIHGFLACCSTALGLIPRRIGGSKLLPAHGRRCACREGDQETDYYKAKHPAIMSEFFAHPQQSAEFPKLATAPRAREWLRKLEAPGRVSLDRPTSVRRPVLLQQRAQTCGSQRYALQRTMTEAGARIIVGLARVGIFSDLRTL